MASKQKEVFELLSEGVDLYNNSIYFSGPIESDFLFLIRTRLELLMYFNKKNFYTLHVNSIGGDLTAVLSVIDYFEHLKKTKQITIDIIAENRCYSSALILLLGATGKKKSFPSTIFMYHEHTSNLHCKKLDEVILKKITKLLKTPLDIWKKDSNFISEFYFDVNDALNSKVIDCLI